MRRRSPIAAAAVLAGGLAVATGAAADTVGPLSTSLAASTATVSACGSLTSATISWNATSGNVTSVAVSGIPSRCAGADLYLTLVSGRIALASAGPVAVTGASVTLTSLSAQPAASTVTGASLAVTGP